MIVERNLNLNKNLVNTNITVESKYLQEAIFHTKKNLNKSEDDNGSRAVFDDVDCFRSQG